MVMSIPSAARATSAALLVATLGLATAGCVEVPAAPSDEAPAPIAVGETREIELYALRFDVFDYEQTITKADILALPAEVRQNLWLHDLDLIGKSGTPRLLDNALAQIRESPLDDPDLTQAERNMVRLLNMTPDTADLEGTELEELLDLAPKVGFAAAEVLAEAAGIGVEDPFLLDWAVTQAVLDGVISSHPNAVRRRGPKTDEHPDGWYDVPPGHVPVSLEDAASDLSTLAERFGPYNQDGIYHPGFISAVSHVKILEDDFSMTIRASANALPFKGIDLTNVDIGNVSSIGRDGPRLFDFSDPSWLQFTGVDTEKLVDTLSFQILEHPDFFPGGTSKVPAPWGNGSIWLAPPWTIERIVSDASLLAFSGLEFSRDWYLGADPAPLFSLDVDGGWMSLVTKGGLGSPPKPLYMWDLMSEVAQVRLHDGPDPDNPEAGAVPEGKAHVRFDLRDVPLGVTTDHVTEAIRRNIEEDPSGLIQAAAALLDQSAGAPDLFYYLPRASAPPAVQGDWLYYLTEGDIPASSNRDYAAYATPGFYADEQLQTKLSTAQEVDGDTAHQKVRVATGDVLFCADDTGSRFRIEVLEKPSKQRILLSVTRVQ